METEGKLETEGERDACGSVGASIHRAVLFYNLLCHDVTDSGGFFSASHFTLL
jgi:hypothetical protein